MRFVMMKIKVNKNVLIAFFLLLAMILYGFILPVLKESGNAAFLSEMSALAAALPPLYQQSAFSSNWSLLYDENHRISNFIKSNSDGSRISVLKDGMVSDPWGNPIMYQWRSGQRYPSLLSLGPRRKFTEALEVNPQAK